MSITSGTMPTTVTTSGGWFALREWHRDAAARRTLPVGQQPRERLADDRHARGVGRVCLGEVPSLRSARSPSSGSTAASTAMKRTMVGNGPTHAIHDERALGPHPSPADAVGKRGDRGMRPDTPRQFVDRTWRPARGHSREERATTPSSARRSMPTPGFSSRAACRLFTNNVAPARSTTATATCAATSIARVRRGTAGVRAPKLRGAVPAGPLPLRTPTRSR